MLATMTSFAQTPPDNRYIGSERDLNGTHSVRRSKLPELMPDSPSGVLELYDLDGNGRLDRRERARLQADQEKLRAIIQAKYDTDKDGHLDARERYAMRHDWGEIADSDK
jgi:hypothetical protein